MEHSEWLDAQIDESYGFTISSMDIQRSRKVQVLPCGPPNMYRNVVGRCIVTNLVFVHFMVQQSL